MTNIQAAKILLDAMPDLQPFSIRYAARKGAEALLMLHLSLSNSKEDERIVAQFQLELKERQENPQP